MRGEARENTVLTRRACRIDGRLTWTRHVIKQQRIPQLETSYLGVNRVEKIP